MSFFSIIQRPESFCNENMASNISKLYTNTFGTHKKSIKLGSRGSHLKSVRGNNSTYIFIFIFILCLLSIDIPKVIINYLLNLTIKWVLTLQRDEYFHLSMVWEVLDEALSMLPQNTCLALQRTLYRLFE